MNQTRTTQTKKSVSKPPNKPSAAKTPATTRRSSTKLLQVMSPQDTPSQIAAINSALESTDIEGAGNDGYGQIMLGPADLSGAAVEDSDDDSDALYQGTEMDDQSELPVEISPEGEVAELPSTAKFTQVMEPLAELSMDNERTNSNVLSSTDENATTREMIDALDESLEDIADISSSREQSMPLSGDAATYLGTSDPIGSDAVEQDDTKAQVLPNKKVKGVERHLRSVNQRYANACNEVSRLRNEFISSLNAKSAHLGVPRVGEAVPMRSTEMEALNAEIREARQTLEALLQRKQQLKGTSTDLDAINTRIREINRQRQAARLEKKAAFEEATKTEPSMKPNTVAV